MREPPADLPTEAIAACLHEQHDLTLEALTFLPLGQDPWAWVYRARTTDDGDYFLKARRQGVNEAGLLIPRCLKSQGVSRVVAPLPTRSGALWGESGAYALVIYPFIEGQTGLARGLTDEQWVEYGSVLRQIHAATPPPELTRRMRRETFRPDGASMVRRIDADLASQMFDEPATRALAAFWQAHRAQILTLLERGEDLGRRLAESAPALVVCHADVHTNNVLVDETDGHIWIADWDEAMLAPRERDLMFAMGGGISRAWVRPRDEVLFLQGYQQAGPVAVDPLGLAYYRYAWAISDIGAYGEQVLYRPDFSAATRQESVELFQSLFAPGNIVSLALASDLSPA